MPDGLRKTVVSPVCGSYLKMLPACRYLPDSSLHARGEGDVGEVHEAVLAGGDPLGQDAAFVEHLHQLGVFGQDAGSPSAAGKPGIGPLEEVRRGRGGDRGAGEACSGEPHGPPRSSCAWCFPLS